MAKVTENYQQVQQRITAFSESANRTDEPVLLAVSKKHKLQKITELAAIGHQNFGESYAQEGVEKIKLISDLNLIWHFIGPIQSNKTKLIAEHFDWVQSVDRMKILKRLSQHRPATLPPLNILLQVKIGDEDSKSGASLTEVLAMAKAAEEADNLIFRGVMCIPPPSQNLQTQITYFQQAKNLFDDLVRKYPQVDTLSMGMSNDLQAAIMTGSTMVRVGTDIFGARAP